jgi:hypothetical protein
VRKHASAALRSSPQQLEDAQRLVVAGARTALDEILSLWPPAEHERIVLWASFGPLGKISTGARFRRHVFDGVSRELARDLRRIRGDVPVVLELTDGSVVVVPLKAIRIDP